MRGYLNGINTMCNRFPLTMKTVLAIAITVAAASPAAARYPRPETDLDVGFILAGTEPWWPIFITLKDGRLMMTGNNQKRYSSDGGRSWSKRQTFVSDDQRVGGLKGIVRMKDGRLGGVFNAMGGIPNEAGRDKQNFYWQNLYFQSSADEVAQECSHYNDPAIEKGSPVGQCETIVQLHQRFVPILSSNLIALGIMRFSRASYLRCLRQECA